MPQETAREIFWRQGHGTALTVVRIVLPTKGDVIAIHGQKPMIRDGHAVGIAGQILQHVLWPAKGSLGINHPVFLKQSAQEGCEGLLVRQRLTRTKKEKWVVLETPP